MSSPIHKFLFSPPSSPPRQPTKIQRKERASPLVAGDSTLQDGHSYGYTTGTSTGLGDCIVLDTPSYHHAPPPGPFSSLTSLKSLILDGSSDALFNYNYSQPGSTVNTSSAAPRPMSINTSISTDDDAYLSNKVPTPVKHIFELGPALPVGMSSRHSRTGSKTHSRGPSLSLHIPTSDGRTHSRNSSYSKRKPSIMVHVEDADFDYEAEYSASCSGSGSENDIDATPKAPSRSPSRVPTESDAPTMAPAPRKASWRLTDGTPPAYTPKPLTAQMSYAKMQYHKRNMSRPNVPSSPLPRSGPTGLAFARSLSRPHELPRPLVRLFAMALLAVGCYWLMMHSHAEVEGRLTFTGAQFRQRVSSDSEWVPRQARSDHMLARAANPLSTRLAQYHPLPSSHELLALQAYLLDSRSHVISSNIDTSKPLDAQLLLPISLLPHPTEGGATDTAKAPSTTSTGEAPIEPEGWLLELEREHADDITIWHMDPTSETSSRVRKVLEEVHGKKRHPTTINLKTRGQAPAVLRRLGYDLDRKEGVLVVIGNEPLMASQVLDMSQKELEAVMRGVGWYEEKSHTGKKRVLVQAQWKKKPALGGGHDEVEAENAKLRK